MNKYFISCYLEVGADSGYRKSWSRLRVLKILEPAPGIKNPGADNVY